MATKKNFSKWWLMLVHGVLLIVLSYFLFTRPGKLLSTFSTIAGLIALLTGVASVIGYFVAGKDEKNKFELFSGLFSCVAGLFFLNNTPLAHKMISWFFAAYMIFNAIVVFRAGWKLRAELNWWWFPLLLLLYTLLVVYFFIAGTTVFNISIVILAGIQFLLTGIVLIIQAFAVNRLQSGNSQTTGQVSHQEVS